MMDADDVRECIEFAAEALMTQRREGPTMTGPTTPSEHQILRATDVVYRFLSECDGNATINELREILGIEV